MPLNYKSKKENFSQKFIELGLDFDNNKYGLGLSSEIENNEHEIRLTRLIKLKVNQIYLRIWVLKYVLVISTIGISLSKKNRINLKLIFGIGGT